ncbi:MAG: hypothetical protein AABZ30_12520 [Myxococcota bacterium]
MKLVQVAMLAVGLLGTGRAHADVPDEPKNPEESDVQHTMSITISPIHLSLPVAEVTAEFRLADSIGVAAIGGFGSVGGFSAYEVGGHFRWYPVGSFVHGMQLGAEVLYLGISDDDIGESGVSGSGNGFAVGPFIGYKIATNVGFTFDAQLGVEKVFARAEASSGSASATAEAETTIPLLNLNVGWSF